eukprot:TRINITY_DN80173_c0_g1_i1.p1 TRINITY_DN80173_c0_g1~~TRINITY_DN80173_c0_g1_i1.p1  ORF type:complete len:515 (+),score=59.98 TRINITY_DN80173_c0_g1_i1:66-1610(+)
MGGRWLWLALATSARADEGDNAKQGSKFYFDELISHVSEFCYKKLHADSDCCMDEHSYTDHIKETINRPGTEWHCNAMGPDDDYDDGPFCDDSLHGKRGTDQMFYADSVTCDSPRVLYVHGGSWFYGSPFTNSYPQLLSRMARMSGTVIMAIDYPLVPVGNASTILDHSLAALNYLAVNGPRGCKNSVADSPPLFIGGDSSGGGSALAALLKLQEAPQLLAGGKKKLAGGFFYSPWTNLQCDTPEYYTHAFARVENPEIPRGAAYIGDIMFNGHPSKNSEDFQGNGLAYVGGNKELLRHSIYSPFYTTGELLIDAPPMYFAVGGAESIMGDSVLLAQKAAMYNVPVYLDIYDGMWHVFPMYSEGCQNPGKQSLWQAVSAQQRAAFFLHFIGTQKRPPCPPSEGRPATTLHYSEPGPGWGRNLEWFPGDFCGNPRPDAADPWQIAHVPVRHGADADLESDIITSSLGATQLDRSLIVASSLAMCGAFSLLVGRVVYLTRRVRRLEQEAFRAPFLG